MRLSILDKGIVYGLSHNGEFVYIGRSFGSHRVNKLTRKREHFTQLRENKHPSKELQDIYNSKGKDSIEFVIIENHDLITVEELDQREIHHIGLHNTYKEGFNKTFGGKTVSGMKHSKETKEKITKSLLGENNPFFGRKHTKEAREKMSYYQRNKKLTQERKDKVSEQWKGVPKSEEHKKKISDSLKGRKLSEESKRKMSESRKGYIWKEESISKRVDTIRVLTDEQVIEIYIKANQETITNKELGEQYGVKPTLISNIKNLKKTYIKEIVENYFKSNGGILNEAN